MTLAATTACQADKPSDGAGAARAAGISPAPTGCAPKFGANDDPSAGGKPFKGTVSEGLPDDVRCLPSVAHGDLISTDKDTTGQPLRSLMVSVVEGTTREQTLALCKRITGLGYSPGGTHKIDMLSVGGDLTAGTYLTTARGECVQAG
ncbi:hypothetical protein AB0442_39050 [Kitasatospora sp. NPDC085895]|uniref:hypothetical protein n=1 Tax=Kitasatospora sp. NPDC085895 TaxID=3155057 RepID=UPI00344FE85D